MKLNSNFLFSFIVEGNDVTDCDSMCQTPQWNQQNVWWQIQGHEYEPQSGHITYSFLNHLTPKHNQQCIWLQIQESQFEPQLKLAFMETFFFLLFGFDGPSKLFHSFWAESIVW